MLDETIRKTIFPRETIREKSTNRNYGYYSPDDDYYESGYYNNLGEKYDEAIDDDEEDLETTENEAKTDLSAVLRSANPRAVLTFAAPEILSAPLFVNFKRAAVFSLNAPQNFNRQLFETAIVREFLNIVTIKNSGENLKWETVSENNSARRELKLPMLGFSINYVLRGNILILTDDGGFLSDILTAGKKENRISNLRN